MYERDDYTPNLSANRLPVWFHDTGQTIAYHLYPDCGHINQRSERELSKRTIPWSTAPFDTLEDWREQIMDNRHLCSPCYNRFKGDLYEYQIQAIDS